jgi:hypothetical protein
MFVLNSLSHKVTTLNIVMNKNVVGIVNVSSANQGPAWQQISRTIILKARKGDHVKVVGSGGGFIHVGHYSGFSGTLLY